MFTYNSDRNAIDIEDANKCNLCEECTKITERVMKLPGAVKIGELPNRFVFTLESTGAISPKKIVTMALKVLKRKLKTLEEFF